MQQRDFDGFVDIMQVVAEQYGKTLSDGVLALYWQGLQGFEFSAVKEALARHLRNPDSGMFMPKIADIVKMLSGSTQDSALRAWSKVDKAVRQVGCYKSVVFDDPIIHRVLHDMGGWVFLSTKTDEEWPFVAREFENRYRGFVAIGTIPEYPKALVGIIEAHNAKGNFKVEPPILIGNPDAASQVMLGGSTSQLLTFTKASDFLEAKPLQLVKEAA